MYLLRYLAHGDAGSPFAAPTSTGNLSMSSPAPGAWPGSPSVPRPSPRPGGTAQSPGSSSHPALHSPQAGTLSDHTKTAGMVLLYKLLKRNASFKNSWILFLF